MFFRLTLIVIVPTFLGLGISCVTSRPEKKDSLHAEECPPSITLELHDLVESYSRIPDEIRTQAHYEKAIAGLKDAISQCDNFVSTYKAADGCVDAHGNILKIKTLEDVCQNWRNRVTEIQTIWKKK